MRRYSSRSSLSVKLVARCRASVDAMRGGSYLRPSSSACQARWSRLIAVSTTCPASYQRTRGGPGAARSRASSAECGTTSSLVPAWKKRCGAGAPDPVARRVGAAAADHPDRSRPAVVAGEDGGRLRSEREPDHAEPLGVDVASRDEQVESAARIDDERADRSARRSAGDRHRHGAPLGEQRGLDDQIAAVAAGAVQEEHGGMAARGARHDDVGVHARPGSRPRTRCCGWSPTGSPRRPRRPRRRAAPTRRRRRGRALRPGVRRRTRRARAPRYTSTETASRLASKTTASKSPRSSPSACSGNGRSHRTSIRSRSCPVSTQSA